MASGLVPKTVKTFTPPPVLMSLIVFFLREVYVHLSFYKLCKRH